jgi:hypothetical protein
MEEVMVSYQKDEAGVVAHHAADIEKHESDYDILDRACVYEARKEGSNALEHVFYDMAFVGINIVWLYLLVM